MLERTSLLFAQESRPLFAAHCACQPYYAVRTSIVDVNLRPYFAFRSCLACEPLTPDRQSLLVSSSVLWALCEEVSILEPSN